MLAEQPVDVPDNSIAVCVLDVDGSSWSTGGLGHVLCPTESV